jgi:hypothetical protein
MFTPSNQSITHIRECHGDSSQYTPCRGKSDNTTYTGSLRPYMWQQFRSTIKELVRAYLTLVHDFHVIPLWAIRGWFVHYPSLYHCRYGRIVSDSATITCIST